MAFFNTDFTHYNSYDSYCDSSQIHPPIPQFTDEPTIYNLFDYPVSPQSIEFEPVDHGAYGYSTSYAANPCYASSYSVPTVIEYDPQIYAQSYQKVSTQFAISYSVSEFNEVEFEEYDPTPYGGGYDICETYGKPLQPSIQICYPPSGKAIAISKEREKVEPQTKPTQIEKDGDTDRKETEEITDRKETEEVTELKPLGDLGYGNGRELNQYPSGYGLEAMDLCESLFGHWPCLSRIKRQTGCVQASNGCGRCHGHCYCYGNYGNQWQTAAEYLFGSSHNPYPDGRGHEDAVYGYQRQYQGEPVYWLNEFKENT